MDCREQVMEMRCAEKRALQRCFAELMDRLFPDVNIFAAEFHSAHIFNSQQLEEIMGKQSRIDQTREMLTRLQCNSSGANVFQILLETIGKVHGKNSDLISMLEQAKQEEQQKEPDVLQQKIIQGQKGILDGGIISRIGGEEFQHKIETLSLQRKIRPISESEGVQFDISTLMSQAIDLMESCGLLIVSGSVEKKRRDVSRYLLAHYSWQDYKPCFVYTLSDWHLIEQDGERHIALLDDVFGGDSMDEDRYEEWCGILSLVHQKIVDQKCLVVITVSIGIVGMIRDRGHEGKFEHFKILDTDRKCDLTEDEVDQTPQIRHGRAMTMADIPIHRPFLGRSISVRQLHQFCKEGDIDKVKEEILLSGNVNALDDGMWSPLHHACRYGWKEIAEELLKGSGNASIKDSNGCTPLHLASIYNHDEIISLLLDHATQKGLMQKGTKYALVKTQRLIDVQDNQGKTALHHASQRGHNDCAATLLRYSADLMKCDKDQNTPLHLACQEGHSIVVHELLYLDPWKRHSDQKTSRKQNMRLIKRSLNCDAMNRAGNSPLHIACKAGNLLVCWKLLQFGVDVNLPNIDQNTPLEFACRQGNIFLVQSLLKYEADPTRHNLDGVTPLHTASSMGHTAIVKLLLEHGRIRTAFPRNQARNRSGNRKDLKLCPLVKAVNNKGETALYLAAERGNIEIVQKLCDNGAKCVVSPGKQQGKWHRETALHVASRKGHQAVTKALLDHMGNVDQKNEDGHTALHLASCFGHNEIVSLLIKKQTNTVNNGDKDGRTALYFATLHGHEQVVRTLLKNKADANIETDKVSVIQTALEAACRKGYFAIAVLLIQHGADTNVTDKKGDTLLQIACQEGHDKIVSLLLERDENCVNKPNLKKWTALFFASENGRRDIVKMLLDKQANPKAKAHECGTALHVASYNNHADVVELLLESGGDINHQNSFGWTALHYASFLGHIDIVKLLLEKDAITDLQTAEQKDGFDDTVASYTAMHFASLMGHSEIVRLLIEKKADVNVLDKDEFTPLHLACMGGHAAVSDILIKHNADIRLAADGSSPLHCACNKGDVTTVDLLLQKGIDVNIKCKSGETALCISCSKGHLEIVKKLLPNDMSQSHASEGDRQLSILRRSVFDKNIHENDPFKAACFGGNCNIVEYFIELGADIHSKDGEENTLLHKAAEKVCCKAAKTLLTFGVKLNSKNKQGMTALCVASFHGNCEMVKFLVQGGTDLSGKDVNGNTALHTAVENGHLDVVKILLENGADASVTNNQGMCPLVQEASSKCRLEIMDILIKKGGIINERDKEGNTSLHHAVLHDHCNVVKRLLNHGADVNASNKQGRVALHVACSRGLVKVLGILLERKDINKNHCDREGKKPVDVATVDCALMLREHISGEVYHQAQNP